MTWIRTGPENTDEGTTMLGRGLDRDQSAVARGVAPEADRGNWVGAWASSRSRSAPLLSGQTVQLIKDVDADEDALPRI